MAHFIRTQTNIGPHWVNVESVQFMRPSKSDLCGVYYPDRIGQ
jgi:hypothetical protein